LEGGTKDKEKEEQKIRKEADDVIEW